MHEWLDELRLEAGPPFSAMGTHALDLDRWLVVDDHRRHDLALKAKLLADERDVVFGALPGSDDASTELLHITRDWLGRHGVEPAPPSDDDHPLIEAARLVQEDLVVLQQIDGEWVLTAGAVCFPTHWTVTDKLGLPLALIHAPVAHYERELRERVDRFHDRLTVNRPVWRRNWFVVPTSQLHLPDREVGFYNVDHIAPDGSPLWLRSERQTLRRLPLSGAIVFTIRIQQLPLSILLARRDIASRMLATTRSWDAVKRAYTSTGGVLDELTEWLDSVANGSA